MINIGEALSSYAKVREGAVDGADCGDLLGYDHSSRKQFEEDFADIIALEEEEFDNDSEMEDDSVFEEGGQNKAGDFEPLLAELQKLGTFSPFAIGGESKLYFSDFHLHVCPVVASTVEFVNLGSIQSLNVESLLGYCEPSSYDLLENKTKIDPAVRLAMECKADQFKIVDEPKPNRYQMEFIYHIRNAVSCNLLKLKFARIKMDHIVLVPNKINIYSENGHFKPHTDTPTHDPALFIGSVVVCLPSEHTGGNLIVRHAGKEVNFDFAAQSNNPDIVQFAAFYGDCEHEVLPVTSGHCIMLTYSILKKTTKEMALSYGDDGPKR